MGNSQFKTLPYDRCQSELRDLISSRFSLIFLRSAEENRAVNCIANTYETLTESAAMSKPGELVQWSITNGLEERIAKNDRTVEWRRISTTCDPNTPPILQALTALRGRLQEKAIASPDCQHLYILPDWPTLIGNNDSTLIRRLKELVLQIDRVRPSIRMNIILLGSDWEIPVILRNHVHIVDLPLPIGEELYKDVFSVAVEKYQLPDEKAQRLGEQAQGMPHHAAVQSARLITTRELWQNPDKAGELLLETKKQEIRKTGVLEYYSPQGNGLSDVGGLECVKTWVTEKQPWFEQDTNPELRPRAILLEGFPGCGKTFIARAIAQEWRVPQINFEISRLQSRWVGESESNTFQALRAIEASAPNILFMDEIEKAFAGVGGDSSGVSTRQFGTFLSWLNDHEYPILFIATSNDREKLPPELFRAGRFDETFIVMPPNTREREEIIQKRAIAYQLPLIPSNTLQYIVAKTYGFSGAELDKLVKETVYIAGLEKEPNETDWDEALARISPQYKTPKMQQLLSKYLELLASGARPASAMEPGYVERLIN
jgi:hypothetical protein